MNMQYRKNLKAVMEKSKEYTDKKIDDLKWELGSHTLDVESDTTTAYTKTVPSGTIKCHINKVGGMSYKSENLLIITTNSYVSKGINATLNNGIISINGTASSSGYAEFVFNINSVSLNGDYYWTSFLNFSGNFTLRSGKSNLILNGFNTVGKAVSNITGTATNFVIGFNVTADTNYSYTVKPMLVKGTTAPTEFSVGFTGIRDTAVTSVVSKGFNIWDEEWEVGGYDDNGDTTSIQAIRSKNYISILPNTDYYFRMPNITNVTTRRLFYTINKELISSTSYPTAGAFTTPSNAYYMKFNTSTGYDTTYNNDICINISGSANGTYKPYQTPITKPIPAEVQALEGYGWGVNDTCYNYIDFENKKFVQKVGRIDLGSLDYIREYNATAQIYRFVVPFSQGKIPSTGRNINVLSAPYHTNADTSVNEDLLIFIASNRNLYVYNNAYTDANTFKEAMNGVYLYYELATPVETDISSYIDDGSIEVEPNGTIIFDNTYNQAVPSEIDYLIEEVKA